MGIRKSILHQIPKVMTSIYSPTSQLLNLALNYGLLRHSRRSKDKGKRARGLRIFLIYTGINYAKFPIKLFRKKSSLVNIAGFSDGILNWTNFVAIRCGKSAQSKHMPGYRSLALFQCVTCRGCCRSSGVLSLSLKYGLQWRRRTV